VSPFDVPPDEMGMDPEATDRALDRMLSGSGADDEWRDVARFVQDLQETVPSSGPPSEELHVAAMVETAHLLAENGDPVVRPVSNAAEPAPQASGLPKQRRKPMQRKRTFARLVLAPIAAAFVVLGGMAYAGALPWSGDEPASVSTLSPSDETTQVPGENDDSQGDNDNQGEDTQGDSSDETSDDIQGDDQGESSDETSDDQGESSDESTSSDDQGENDDSQGENDNQGEDTQSDGSDQTSDDSQGDGGSDASSGDQQGDSQD
jgi:hypothetical protein